MCGIIGYTGKHPSVPLLLEGLKTLEYRGYDSAGIAISSPDGIRMEKAKGRLSVLEDRLSHGLGLHAAVFDRVVRL